MKSRAICSTLYNPIAGCTPPDFGGLRSHLEVLSPACQRLKSDLYVLLCWCDVHGINRKWNGMLMQAGCHIAISGVPCRLSQQKNLPFRYSSGNIKRKKSIHTCQYWFARQHAWFTCTTKFTNISSDRKQQISTQQSESGGGLCLSPENLADDTISRHRKPHTLTKRYNKRLSQTRIQQKFHKLCLLQNVANQLALAKT